MPRPLLALAFAALALLAWPASGLAQAGPQLGPGALNRYADPDGFHIVTPVPVGSPYRYASALGYLLAAGGPGRRAIHGCRVDGRDHLLSLDPGCEGGTSLGRYGFA